MKKVSFIFLISLTLIISSEAVEFVTYEKAKDSYVCMAVDATGFNYNLNNKQWQSARFKIENSKYLLQKQGKDGWRWSEFGSETKTFCPTTSKWFSDIGFISCKTYHGSFDLNLNTLKYVNATTSGYTDNATDNKFQPFIEIGTCVAL